MRKLIVASSLLLAATAVADEGIHIPEPIVFDLVHGLGVEKSDGAEIDEDDTDFSAGFRFIYATT